MVLLTAFDPTISMTHGATHPALAIAGLQGTVCVAAGGSASTEVVVLLWLWDYYWPVGKGSVG